MKKLLFILFAFHFSLFTVNAQIINTIAGNGIAGSSGDGGPATAAELYGPTGIFIDKTGNIYISDALNNKIRMINAAGIINTIAGNGYNPGGFGGYSGDGGPAINAELYVPGNVFLDNKGNVYITDTRNNRIRIVNTAGVINTMAGNGAIGRSGDGGPATAAELSGPAYSCLDSLGNLFISDETNYRIRKVNTAGIISTIAGGGIQNPGDGGLATAADLEGEVFGISVNDSGNIYLAVDNNKVRKINTSGIIYTAAGNGISGFYGDGGPAIDAELNGPIALYTDAFSNIILSDVANNRVRIVNSSGIIATIVGNGVEGFSGDGGSSIDAEINIVEGIFEDSTDNLYISDYYNNRIRKVTTITGIASMNTKTDFTVFPNPTNKQLTINFNRQTNNISGGLATLTIMDITGRELITEPILLNSNDVQVNVSSLIPGMYFISIKSKEFSTTQKFIKY